jgi:DNA modification methylase
MNGEIINGDSRSCLKMIADETAQCCVTSPPYFGLRDYGITGQIGREPMISEYISNLVDIFKEVKRVLAKDGTLWLNLGDSYASSGKNRTEAQAVAKSGLNGGLQTQTQILKQQSKIVEGLKSKDLIGIPWRVALALQADGWYLRQDIIWQKPNVMPESVTDRCTKSHEYIFLLSKSPKYYFDSEAIKEPAICGAKGSEFHTGKTGIHQLGRSQKVRPSKPKGSFIAKGEPLPGQLPFRAVVEMRNKRSVWTVSTKPFKGAHFATFPPELIEPMILAGSRPGDIVIDPFFGAGTVGLVSQKHGRQFIGIELNPEYCKLALERIDGKK